MPDIDDDPRITAAELDRIDPPRVSGRVADGMAADDMWRREWDRT
jgi:hypothetical protein